MEFLECMELETFRELEFIEFTGLLELESRLTAMLVYLNRLAFVTFSSHDLIAFPTDATTLPKRSQFCSACSQTFANSLQVGSMRLWRLLTHHKRGNAVFVINRFLAKSRD